MPKLKPNDKEFSSRVVRACISSNKELLALGDDFLAIKVGLPVRTFKEKIKNPYKFTTSELWELSKVLKLTPVQAASIVLGRPLTSKEVKDFILL